MAFQHSHDSSFAVIGVAGSVVAALEVFIVVGGGNVGLARWSWAWPARFASVVECDARTRAITGMVALVANGLDPGGNCMWAGFMWAVGPSVGVGAFVAAETVAVRCSAECAPRAIHP